MDPHQDGDEAERARNEYLRLRGALHDRITGLPAYPLLFDRLRAWLDDRRYVGVLHVDVANLDLVESLYGWQVFDRILARVASLLKGSVGVELPEGTLLAINGVAGDRFVAFVREASGAREVGGEDLGRLASLLQVRLEAAFDEEDFASLSPRLLFRTGHSLLSDNPYYRFERRVHAAVEEARTLNARRARRRDLTLGAELKRIIRDAAVSTVFQPVVDLGTLAVIGYEALARGPKDTLFEMPRTMFALSDRLGVAVDLDRVCRKTALLESKGVAGRGSGKIFLNVLPGSLQDPEWIGGSVGSQLEAASLGPPDVVLEVSERGADTDLDRLAAAFATLKAHGFGLALDDVGTGYASLATLQRVRPDYLKVDASLVRGIHQNLIQQELLSSLVQIGRQMGAAVIAEGVEAEEEAAARREAGARDGQGFLVAVPAGRGIAGGPVRSKESGH